MTALLKRISLKLRFVLGSLFYLLYVPQAYLYSWKRDLEEKSVSADRADRKAASPPTTDLIPPGNLLNAESIERGAHFYFEQAELDIHFLAPDLVRVNWYPGLPSIPYAIIRDEWDAVETKLEDKGDRWTVSSAALQITVGSAGSVTVCDPYRSNSAARTSAAASRQSLADQANLHPEEHIYGLGERASTLNLRAAKDEQQHSKTYRMWNFDAAGMYAPGADPMYICIPLYLGLHSAGSYLIFYENSFEAEFTFADVATADFTGGSLRYYIEVGEPPQLLERYTELTGHSPLLARWALGYHQSRWGYRNEAVIREEAQTFRSLDLPLSAIHLDIDCQVGHRAFSIAPKRFSKLASFTQELAEIDVRFITINNPGIKYDRASNLFLEGQILEAFCTYPSGELVVVPVWAGRTVFPDFTNPKVRAWWGRQYPYLLDVGVAGFWHDMNEPAAFVVWGDRSLPKVARHCLEGRGGNHQEAHNVYGLMQAKAGYESLRQYRPQQRPFIVSRSGWAGLQRYAWTWTGDIETSWGALRQTVATVVGLGLSGIPYSGPDIGGFQGNPSAELYLRWFQMATFLTFCRTHVSNNVQPRAPWTFGEPYLGIIREFLKLRYRLMPYFYTLAWEASQTGHPLVRPLFWLDSMDQTLWDVEDAFCLGDALMVCPIVQEGARSRQVMLSKGQWYNFWTDAELEGGQTVAINAPLEQIPLLVKAGSILPMEADGHLMLHLYASQGTSEAVLYGDAEDGYGASRLDRFRLSRSDAGLELTWEPQGDYEFPYEAVRLHIHGMALRKAMNLSH